MSSSSADHAASSIPRARIARRTLPVARHLAVRLGSGAARDRRAVAAGAGAAVVDPLVVPGAAVIPAGAHAGAAIIALTIAPAVLRAVSVLAVVLVTHLRPPAACLQEARGEQAQKHRAAQENLGLPPGELLGLREQLVDALISQLFGDLVDRRRLLGPHTARSHPVRRRAGSPRSGAAPDATLPRPSAARCFC